MSNNETKRFYESKGVWGGVLTMVLGTFGVWAGINPADNAELVEQGSTFLSESVTSVLVIVSGAIALWGRLTASKKITSSK